MIKIEGLSKFFRTEEVETIALNNVSLEVKDGEFVAIMGPSGCGKSTLLNILGLLDNPTSGDYYLAGKEVGHLKEKERTQVRKGNIGFVFQSFNLIDELNVFENVAFPLREQKLPRDEIEQKVNEMLALVKLTGFERRNVTRLSGGQQQRVAIARVAARRAARRARPEAAQGHAAGAQKYPEGHRHHVCVRHARSRRSAEHVRHDCRHVRGQDPADRHAARYL